VTTHLRVAAGGHLLLLPSVSVQHVSDESGDDRPRLDLAHLLDGGATTGSITILYGDDADTAIHLAVDEVIGLVDLPDDMLARLPPLSPRFAQLFDSISVEAIDGCHPLCLRGRIAAEGS
jgi:hypothetical protein